MQAFVAVALGRADPITQAVRAGLVVIGNERIHAPTVGLLQFVFGFHDDADSEHIVHFFEGHVLLQHLVVDAVDAFGPPFDLVGETFLVQTFLDGQCEAADEAFAHGFTLLQFRFDLVVDLGLLVFEREILQLVLDVVQAKAMGEGRVEKERFAGDLQLLVAGHVVQRAHVVQPIREFDQDHAHILRQGQQHFAEVLRLHAVRLELHPADLREPINDGGDRGAEHVAHLIQRQIGVLHGIMQQRGRYTGGAQTDLRRAHAGHFDRVVDVRLTTFSALLLVCFNGNVEGLTDHAGAFPRALARYAPQQILVARDDLFPLLFRIDNVWGGLCGGHCEQN